MRQEIMRPRVSLALPYLRFQIPIMLFLAVIIPAILRHPLSGANLFHIAEIQNAMIVASGACVASLICLRQVTAFPGVRTFVYILPTFAVGYGLALVVLLAFRLYYSSIYLTSSFAIALLTAFAINYWVDRNSRLRFYLVPNGNLSVMHETPDAEWIVLDRAEVPSDPRAMIVADLRWDHLPEWERMLAEAAVRGLPVCHTKQLRESLTGRVSIEHLSENSFGSLLPNRAYHAVKRFCDVMGATILLVVLFAPLLALALAIRLDSKGPALFRQERMGYRGQPFEMLKFRTMRQRPTTLSAEEARLDAITHQDDARITRLGRILRRTRIDELPQLYNVFLGHMSLIGPRPEATALSHWYEAEIPFYFYRHIVRPGMSGWAQMQQGHVTDLQAVNEKLAYDFYYIKNFSAWLDIIIAIRTVAVMASGFGSK